MDAALFHGRTPVSHDLEQHLQVPEAWTNCNCKNLLSVVTMVARVKVTSRAKSVVVYKSYHLQGPPRNCSQHSVHSWVCAREGMAGRPQSSFQARYLNLTVGTCVRIGRQPWLNSRVLLTATTIVKSRENSQTWGMSWQWSSLKDSVLHRWTSQKPRFISRIELFGYKTGAAPTYTWLNVWVNKSKQLGRRRRGWSDY
jgi:hypothetical protein